MRYLVGIVALVLIVLGTLTFIIAPGAPQQAAAAVVVLIGVVMLCAESINSTLSDVGAQVAALREDLATARREDERRAKSV